MAKNFDKENREKIERLERIFDLFKNKDLLNSIGQTWRRRVVDRTTTEHKDINDRAFRAYSEGHLKKRKKKGLGSDVDLIFRSVNNVTMLNQIDHLISNDISDVKMFFKDARSEEIARYHNIEGAGKSKVIRRFWGLTDQDVQEITDFVQDEFNKILEAEL